MVGTLVVVVATIVFLSFLSWRNASISNGSFVRMNDLLSNNIYVAHGRVKKIIFQEWDVENRYGRILKSDWESGCTYFYDESGNTTQIIELWSPNDSLMTEEGYLKAFRNEFSYAKNGILSSTKSFDKKGVLTTSSRVEFDQNGYPRFETLFNPNNGKPTSTYNYEIKNHQHWVKKYFNSLEKLTSEEDIEFWSTAIPKKKMLFDIEEEGRVLSRSERYDRRGLMIAWELYSTDNGKTKPRLGLEYERDLNSEIKKIKAFDSTKKYTHIPDYKKIDEHGNWTELLWLADGRPIRLLTRNIEYHE